MLTNRKLTEAQILDATDLSDGIYYEATDTGACFFILKGKAVLNCSGDTSMSSGIGKSMTSIIIDNTTDINIDGDQDVPILGLVKENSLNATATATEVTLPKAGRYLMMGGIAIEVASGGGEKEFQYQIRLQTDEGIGYEDYGIPLQAVSKSTDTGGVFAIGDIRASTILSCGVDDTKVKYVLTKISAVGGIESVNYTAGSFLSFVYLGK